MVEMFKELYYLLFKDKAYDSNICNAVLTKWGDYSQKISANTLTLEEYTNRKDRCSSFLTHFLEFESSPFGISKGHNANQYMVKMNDDDTYYLGSIGMSPEKKDATQVDANTFFNTNILPLFNRISQCSSIDDIVALESDSIYTNYSAKQVLLKAFVLEANLGTKTYKYALPNIYDQVAIDYLYKIFACNGARSQIEKSYMVLEAAYGALCFDFANRNIQTTFEISKALWELYSPSVNLLTLQINNAINSHKQIVLTGAPGTGKTYSATQFAKEFTEKNGGAMEFVQFHPSYDYSDFVEGLRPVVLSSSVTPKPTFVKMDGVFKEFCRKIVSDNFNTMKKNNVAEPENFYSFYRKHESEINTKYFFIIDEINRADLSKVFGELMYGLEESYRGIENSFNTQYQNLKTYEVRADGKAYPLTIDFFEKGFFVPKNLYIIGTMNDIDKSVESFDFALRRRFEWIEVKANDVIRSALSKIVCGNQKQISDLAEKIKAMNDVISSEGKEFGLSDSYHVGPSYFKGVDANNKVSIKYVFDNNITSILKEYTRGRDKEKVKVLIDKCRNALMG